MMGVQLCKKPRIFAARRSTVAATGRSHRNQQKQRGVAPRTCWWHFTWWPLRWKKLPKNGEDSNGFFWCSKIWFKPGRWFQPPTSFLRRSHGAVTSVFFSQPSWHQHSTCLGGGFSSIVFMFTSKIGGRWTHFDEDILSKGLVQPPTSCFFFLNYTNQTQVNHDSERYIGPGVNVCIRDRGSSSPTTIFLGNGLGFPNDHDFREGFIILWKEPPCIRWWLTFRVLYVYRYIYIVLPHVHLKYTLHKTNISLRFYGTFLSRWSMMIFLGFRLVGYGLLSCRVIDCVSPMIVLVFR